MLAGTLMAASQNFTSIFPLQIGGETFAGYNAFWALLANIVVEVAVSVVQRAAQIVAPVAGVETVQRRSA
jgi:hypothetical protein